MDWRDVPHLLALARAGNLAQAARATGTDPTTVRRRIDALEKELGAQLVVRGNHGWRLTDAGKAAVSAARRAEAAMNELAQVASGSATEVRGRVRIATVEVIGSRLIMPILPRLMERHPGLTVDLLCSTRVLDLVAGEADVALRTVRPTQAAVRCRRLASVVERPYASTRLLERLGIRAEDITSLDGMPVALLLGPSDAPWMARLGEPEVVMRTTSASIGVQAIRRGLAVGLVPDVVAAMDDRLVPLTNLDVPRRVRDLWLACPESLAHVARVRAVMDYLAERVPVGLGSR